MMSNTKRIAIIQSNYIPWKGYFDLISAVDEFVIYDEVQFTKNDWRNRNKIVTPQGSQWLTIPVEQSIHKKITDIKITNRNWRDKHWKSLKSNYSRSANFKVVSEFLENIYLQSDSLLLSNINRLFINEIAGFLNISTNITDSESIEKLSGYKDRNERLLEICLRRNAGIYVTGPSARNYLNVDLFESENIKIEWFSYEGYKSYPQLWGSDFDHYVSIVDLLFNCGERSKDYML